MRWSERLATEIPRAFERGEKTISEIADTFRVTEATAIRHLRVPVRERRAHDIRILHLRGEGRLTIAARLGLAPDTVSAYLHELSLGGEIASSACPHCGR